MTTHTRVPIFASLLFLAFFAGVTGVSLAYNLAYILLALLILSAIWSRAVARRITVQRESPSGSFMVGEPFSERFTVHNGSWFPMPYCEVRERSRILGYRADRVCALNGRGSASWIATGVFDRRGRHSFGPLEARVGDPFGLFPRTVLVAPRADVVVYPALHPVEKIGTGWTGGNFDESVHGRPIDVAPEVSTIREYVPGDSLSRIHWSSTARTGRLMSRTYETRQSSDLLVVVDLQASVHVGAAPDSTLEYAMSMAASVVHAATRRGRSVGLITNDHDNTTFVASKGDTQRMRLLEYFALATADGVTPLSETIARRVHGWHSHGGLVIITPSTQRSWIDAALDVGVRGQRHLAIHIDPQSFGADGSPLRVSAAWRVALDWWIIHNGDLRVQQSSHAVAV